MSKPISAKHQELVAKLREVFQINRPELDFGIYRILNARATEINEYLDKRLLEKVQASLAQGQAANAQSLQAELDEATKRVKSLGENPDDMRKVKEAREKLASNSVGASEHENAVFSHLLTFFSRYYDNGDFISQRRYKGDTYAIPYAGEEVMLHWANKDQYYTKSGENFSNYSFKLTGQNGQPSRTVHFRLVAADTAKDNRKDNDKDRRFALTDTRTVARLDAEGEAFEETLLPVEEIDGATPKAGKELLIRFEYKAVAKGIKQESLIEKTTALVLANAAVKSRWLDLGSRAPTEKNPQRTLLEKHLSDYTTKNTADYFIHKDLGGFLRRELDFYIKNEVMHLDDVQSATAFADIEKNLRMIQCLRTIAKELITFLAQLEDFQKKLWLKKKFVVSSHYCVTLDRVPETLWAEILANEKQWRQWFELGMRETEEPGTLKDLQDHPYLMVDTALFTEAFKSALIQEMPDLDEQLGATLTHSDNFQGLNLLGKRYQAQVKCVYIDPPYNTSSSAILYKNTFKHSAWASMMQDRVRKIAPLMPQDGAIFVSIDKHERTGLEHVMSEVFGEDNQIEELIWAMNTNNSQAPNYSTNHEYVLVFAKNRAVAEQDKSMFREPKPGYAEVMELVARLNPDYPPISVIEQELKQLYKTHQIEYREMIEAEGLEWDDEKKNDPWKGLFNYSNAEYRDQSGRLVNEPTTGTAIASIWIWREGDTSMPANKQSPTVDDPSHMNWRWYDPIHPVTGKPAPHPKRGWNCPYRFNVDSPQKRCFETLDRDGRIAWGSDEKKVPQIKRFLHEAESNVGKSVFSDYSDGEKQTHALFNRSGVFLAPKHANFVARFIQHASNKDSMVLDCFAGSGSTGHAVMTANREDKGKRKFLLIEQGEYFTTIIKPRIQKVVYSPEWKAGKPVSHGAGMSFAFKVLKLESYEDTLNNLQLIKHAGTRDMFGTLPQAAQDDYLMRYMLDVESRGSLLSVEDFKKPFDYTLNIAVDSAGAFEPRKVDMVETFNYLIGLRVRTIDAQLDRGFVSVTGTLPSGERCLVLWRDCEKIDYDQLRREANRYELEAANSLFDVIYINGDHNIPASYTPTAGEEAAGWAHKIRQIEPEFLACMFSVEDI